MLTGNVQGVLKSDSFSLFSNNTKDPAASSSEFVENILVNAPIYPIKQLFPTFFNFHAE